MRNDRPSRGSRVASAALLVLALAAAPGCAAAAARDEEGPFAPDRVEPGSVEAIREATTSPEYLPETVAYLPDSDTVPSPTEVLGHLVGAPGELSRVADVHGYFRRLAATSPRVRVSVIGTSEEGREILLAAISAQANLARLDRLAEITRRLADPRATPRPQMERLVREGRPFYYLLGGLHSTETGSPEMLMELAYRLAVSERPEIRAIREGAVVLITPVVETDGRDRQVEWYERHLRGRGLSYEELREFASPPYWGHYVFHDNNRDGMQLTLALTRAVNSAYFRFHPQVLHDLHESVPLLYASTGHGPYSLAVDPVTVNEWTQFAYHEAGALQAQGLPGVWTWGFWDGWWPGYLFSVANNHNSVGRFYETFGNGVAETLDRKLEESRFAGQPVTKVQWYRPWPPDKKVKWSLRDNTNYMEAGVLEALGYASLHGRELLGNFWRKGERAVRKGREEAPYAWVFPPEQRDPGLLAHLVNLLRAHRIEVHRLEGEFRLEERVFPAGSYVVRMDQPYRGAARNFLEVQKFPPDEPNRPYDDVAWTWPLLFGVDGKRIDDRSVLEAEMTLLEKDVRPEGGVEGTGEVFLLADRGRMDLLAARVRLAKGGVKVEAAEKGFEAGGGAYPRGSWIVRGPRRAVEETAAALGLRFRAGAAPGVPAHPLDLPRLAVLHTWTSTQDCGWVRYALDRAGVEYDLLSPEGVRRGGLRERYDVILFPNAWGDLARMVHGIDPSWGPLAYTATEEYPSHGIPDASPDITGGMGFEGLIAIREFLAGGGVLAALGNAGTLAVDGGLVRRVRKRGAASFVSPGSELRAKFLRPDHPIAYGYEEETSVFRGNLPLYDVAERDRGRVVLQFGTKRIPPPEKKKGEAGEGEEAPGEKEARGKLVLSGFVKKAAELDGKPAILDIPAGGGGGRVILFSFNPMHRHLNLSDYRLVYNLLLNWNDLPPAAPRATGGDRTPSVRTAGGLAGTGSRRPDRPRSPRRNPPGRSGTSRPGSPESGSPSSAMPDRSPVPGLARRPGHRAAPSARRR